MADRLKKRGWTIVGFAHFASKPRKPTTTYLSIAASPLEFGSFSRIDYTFKDYTLGFGRGLTSKIGGLFWRRRRELTGRDWLL
jgi:hypothetical protein